MSSSVKRESYLEQRLQISVRKGQGEVVHINVIRTGNERHRKLNFAQILMTEVVNVTDSYSSDLSLVF